MSNSIRDSIQDQAFGVIPVLQGTAPHFLYLLVQHKQGHWGFPKGHAYPWESPERTAQREFREETGLSACQLLPGLQFTEQYKFLKRKKSRWVHKTVLYFVGEVAHGPSGKPPTVTIQPEEIIDFRWCRASQALMLLTYEAGRQTLQDCDRALSDTC